MCSLMSVPWKLKKSVFARDGQEHMVAGTFTNILDQGDQVRGGIAP